MNRIPLSWVYHGFYCLAIALLAVLTLIAFLFAVLVYIQLDRVRYVPKGVPWVGLGERKWFAKVRASMNDLFVGRTVIDEGYEKYSKNNLPFVLPSMHWAEVVLPPSQIHWLISQPETALNGFKPQDDIFGFEYLAHGPDLAAVHDFTVIRRELTRQLTHILPDLLEELGHSIDEHFGLDDKEWNDVKLFPAIEMVSAQSINRIFVGKPLCRNKSYLKTVQQFTTTLAMSGIVFRNFLTEWMKPKISPIVALATRFATWRGQRHLEPLIRARLAQSRLSHEDSKGGDGVDGRPNDMLQWLIDSAAQRGASSELSIENMSGKLLLFNLFDGLIVLRHKAGFTTSITTTTLIYDLLSLPSPASILDELREESIELLPQLTASSTALRTATPKLDSTIRESLRVSSMFARGTSRKVVHPAGVTMPDGLHLPQGSHVGVAVANMHRDPAVQGWEDAGTFEPLRYYRLAQESGEKQTSAVQISERYLAFSLGRHACPGRFFALEVLKLILAYLVVHYDFEPRERPEFIEIAEAAIPSSKSTIRVRRRNTKKKVEPDGLRA